MPVRGEEIEIFDIAKVTARVKGGQMGQVMEIRFRIRKGEEHSVTVPIEEYTKQRGEQAVLAYAAEIVDLLDAYPVKE